MYNHEGLMLMFLKDALLNTLKSFPFFSTRVQPRGSVMVTGGGDICDKPGGSAWARPQPVDQPGSRLEQSVN